MIDASLASPPPDNLTLTPTVSDCDTWSAMAMLYDVGVDVVFETGVPTVRTGLNPASWLIAMKLHAASEPSAQRPGSTAAILSASAASRVTTVFALSIRTAILSPSTRHAPVAPPEHCVSLGLVLNVT